MKYLVWILVGSVCGAALGILGPYGMFLFVMWKDGDRAMGVGTPFAIMMILTIPCGALLGAYAGFHRAATGGWAGFFSFSLGKDLRGTEESRSKRKSLPQFEREWSAMTLDEALDAKQQYLRELEAELNNTKLNHPLVIVTGLLGLLFTPLLVVPLYFVIQHEWAKHELRDQQKRVKMLV